MKSDPESTVLRLDLSDTLAWRGSIALRLGQFERADNLYRQAVELIEYLVQQEPGNKEFVHRAVTARYFVAKSLAVTGRPAESQTLFERDREIQRGLVRHDPGNKDWLQTLVLIETRLARLLKFAGDISGSVTLAADALEHLEPPIDPSRLDLTFTENKVECYELNSRLNLRSGRIEKATGLMESALDTARAAYGADKDSHGSTTTLALALVLSGDVNQANGRTTVAQAAWREAVQLLEPRAAESDDYEILDPLIRSLISLGEHQRAEPLISRLQATGYRPLEPWDAG